MVGIPEDQLPKDYASFSITNADENKTGLSELIDLCSAESESFILHKGSLSGVTGVFAKNMSFSPDITEGRSLSEDDFITGKNVIIISEELKNETFLINNKRYYNFDGILFETVGIYKKSDNRINEDSIAYYNLNSNEVINSDSQTCSIVGSYKFAANDTQKVLNRIDKPLGIKITKSSVDNTLPEKIQKAVSAQAATVIALILVAVLVIINSLNTTSCWIENRKKEISIRRMVGASNINIYLLLIKDYWLLLTVSFIPSVGLAYIIGLCKFEFLVGFDFSLTTILISYAAVLLISLLTVSVMIVFYSKKSISSAVRC